MTADHSRRGFAFESFIAKLIERLGYKIEELAHPNRGYDIIASSMSTRLLVEVKFSKGSYVPAGMIRNAVERLSNIACKAEVSTTAILVVSGHISRISPILSDIEHYNVHVLDIGNILYLVNDFPDLYDELISMLKFTTMGIIPYKPTILSDISELKPNNDVFVFSSRTYIYITRTYSPHLGYSIINGCTES